MPALPDAQNVKAEATSCVCTGKRVGEKQEGPPRRIWLQEQSLVRNANAALHGLMQSLDVGFHCSLRQPRQLSN